MEITDNFADYILNEKSVAMKMDIMYYMAKRTRIFYDKTIILKTEIARMFVDYMDIDVDKNLLLTASLLCNCKKIDNAQKLGKIETYASEGAEYLKGLGFNSRFCRICEQLNRYSESEPREKESDVLELVDQFGGLILDRPEREGFMPEEALVVLKDRNLKGKNNRYLEEFITFIKEMETIYIKDTIEVPVIKKLTNFFYRSSDIREFTLKVVNEYSIKVDKLIENKKKEKMNEILNKEIDPNRPLFSKETAYKIMNHEARILGKQ